MYIAFLGTAVNESSFARNLALRLVDFHQRHISPRKGFSCPHRVLPGGLSCSQHTKLLLQTPGLPLWTVWRNSFLRLQECSDAASVLEMAGGSRMRCYVIPCCLPL